MDNIQHQYLPYNLAKKLQDLGLKPNDGEWCTHYIPYTTANGDFIINLAPMSGNCVFAPTYDQVLAWLRDKHNVHIVINAVMGQDQWSYELVDLKPQSDMTGEWYSWIPEKSEYPVNTGYYHNLNLAITEFINLYKNMFIIDNQ